MSLNEALGEGLMVTVVGLVIVFSVLAILMVALIIMKLIFYKEPEKCSITEKSEPKPIVAKKEETVSDDTELIAVLTAAIAASLNTSTYNLNIKSYRRVEGKNTAWKDAGVSELFGSRL